MKYISTLREGERINEIFLCKSKQTAMTKSGKPYDNVILQDKTGTLDAKIWDVGSVGIEEFDAMDYIAITGDITSFQGNLQCSIKRARKVNVENMTLRIICRSAIRMSRSCIRSLWALSAL